MKNKYEENITGYFDILRPAAKTIAKQAAKLGYNVYCDRADTGTAYLTLTLPVPCDDPDCCDPTDPDTWCDYSVRKEIRVSDHDYNSCRGAPDYNVEDGFQLEAIVQRAKWADIDPDSVPYIKHQITRRRRR